MFRLITGKSEEVLKDLEDNSIDSIVTDPPYSLNFMGQDWDKETPDIWEEVYRVLRPGAHLLAFGSPRLIHRMTCAIEDTKMEIRDTLVWAFGSGFPKSLDLGKAYEALKKTGGSAPQNLRKIRMGDDYKPTGQEDYAKGRMFSSDIENDTREEEIDNDYTGFGTTLKPSIEMIVLARKPISEKTIIQNVIEHNGCGGLNIDDSRISGFKPVDEVKTHSKKADSDIYGKYGNMETHQTPGQKLGRFPANFLHDGSPEVVAEFPITGKGNNKKSYSYAGREYNNKDKSMFNLGDKPQAPSNYNDDGSASRYFKVCPQDISPFKYCPKASKKEKNEGLEGFQDKNYSGRFMNAGEWKNMDIKKAPNTHTCVKPVSLMKYLCRLITPKDGTILDPFMGSGSTGIAAIAENFDFIGIDMEEEFVAIAEARIAHQWRKMSADRLINKFFKENKNASNENYKTYGFAT